VTLIQEPEFLELEDVLELHEEGLRRQGGSSGVRDQGLLESALAQPRGNFGGQWAHGDLFLMAAAYAFHIAQNQPFIDGNKRAALAAAIGFLMLNGIEHVPDPSDCLYEAMIGLAHRTLDKEGLANLLATLAGRQRVPWASSE
jgi:death-on-curing protein